MLYPPILFFEKRFTIFGCQPFLLIAHDNKLLSLFWVLGFHAAKWHSVFSIVIKQFLRKPASFIVKLFVRKGFLIHSNSTV